LQQQLGLTYDSIWRLQTKPKVPCLMHRHKQWKYLVSLLAMVGFIESCSLVNQGKPISCNGVGFRGL